jgi:O-antigen/teichoic acid export membrane protein
MPVGFLVAIFRSTGRMAWSEWLGNARALAALAAVPLVLALGGGMPALAAAQLVPLAAVAAIALWCVRARWPMLLPRPSAARWSALRALMAPSLLFALFTLGNALALQGAVLLIVAQLGGAAVAVFVTSRTLTNLLRQAVFTANNALWPHLTAMEAAGDVARLRAVHRLLVAGSAALSIAFAAALWQVGPEVMAAWTGGALAADVELLRLLLVQAVLQAPWVASSVVPLAVNRPRAVALGTAAASALGLGVAAALIGHWGLAAVPIGLIVGELVACAVFVPRAACRLVGEDYLRFALRQWRAVAVGAALAGGAAWAAAEVAMGPAPLRWLEIGAVAFLASALVAWRLGLHGADRAAVARNARASLARLTRPGRLAEA